MKLIIVLFAVLGLAAAARLPLDLMKGLEGRIVGGQEAVAGQFPYQASIRTQFNWHFCGGFVANERWVIFAAHCTFSQTTTNTIVVVGALDREFGGFSHTISGIFNHREFHEITLDNDISAVQVAVPFTFNVYVQPIPLGTTTIGGSVPAVVSGWGQTSNPGNMPWVLQWLNVQSMTMGDCRAAHANSGYVNFVFDTTICADSPVGQGVCFGDSGGPLVAGGAAIGVVSWSVPCGNAEPDVYARVSSHIEWLNSVIN